MSDETHRPLVVTCLKNYGTHYGVVESNILSPAVARTMFDQGDNLAVLVGPHDDPHYVIQVFRRRDAGDRRIDVFFFDNLARESAYLMHTRKEQTGLDTLFLSEFNAYRGAERQRTFIIFVDDGNTQYGDFPRLIFDDFAGPEMYAVSVPPEDFDLGPFPTFDDLISGKFVAGLPPITIPPRDLWEPYIPQSTRTRKRRSARRVVASRGSSTSRTHRIGLAETPPLRPLCVTTPTLACIS